MTSRSAAPVRSRVLAVGLALVLALAGLVAPTRLVATAQAAPATTLKLTGPEKIRLGKKATLTIAWTKKGKKATGTVRLQAKRDGAWVSLAKVKVTNGKAKVKVKPTATTRYRLSKGTRVSKVVKVKVGKSWVDLKAIDGSIKAGDAARLEVSNVKRGVPAAGPVELQVKSGKKWTMVSKLAVGPSGKATITVKPTTSSAYRAVRATHVSAEQAVAVTRDWIELAIATPNLANSSSTTDATIRWYAAGKPATGTVRLQERVASGKWTTSREVAVTNGTAKISIQPTTPRRYRVKVGSLTSAVVKVKVKVVIPASFTIKGSGWGHGLGMSQYGAYAMAQAGKSVDEILTHYYTDTATEQQAFPTSNDGTDQLSVQLIGASPDNKTSVPVTVRDGGWRLRNAAGGTVTSLGSGKELTFKVESGKVAAYQKGISSPLSTDSLFRLHWEGTRYYKPTSSKQTYVDVAGTHGSYRHGRLEVTVRSGKINIVNNLLLNTEYLYGIAEMPSSWGIKGPASLQAQAIAARNYAATSFLSASGAPVKVPDGCRCHIVDDTRDQNFTGWKKENEGSNAYYGKLWKAAVDATVSDGGAKGKVLRYTGANNSYRGKLVTAYYSSSTGGATLNSEDAWSAVVPYIRSVDDPWSLDPKAGNPNATWTATFTQSQARSFFGLPDVVAISVSKTYKGGGMAELTATSSAGATKTASGKADAMRTRLNAAASGYVKSAWVSAFSPVGAH